MGTRRRDWLLPAFTPYARLHLRRHFHALRLYGPAPKPSGPIIVCLNHPSWWDPLVCMVLARACFAARRHAAPIDEAMLRRYRFFAHLGLFGVQPDSAHGAQQLLQAGSLHLADERAMLWITAEGRFTDVREPLRLRPGFARLAARFGRGSILPLALEYPFWDQRLPEILVRFGHPLPIAADASAEHLHDAASEALNATRQTLAEAARSRDPGRFSTLLHGGAGTGAAYDWWLRMRGREIPAAAT